MENQNQPHEVKKQLKQPNRRYKKKDIVKSYKDYLQDLSTLDFNKKY
jgi:hypothetical protein